MASAARGVQAGRNCWDLTFWGWGDAWKQNSGPGSLGPPGSGDIKCFLSLCFQKETREVPSGGASKPTRRTGECFGVAAALLSASI